MLYYLSPQDLGVTVPSLDSTTKIPVGQLPTGTTAGTVALGNDSRFTDARTPSGAAGGALSGTYPNPTLTSVPGGSPSSSSTAIRTRAGTMLAWIAASPTLAAGEVGYETDTGLRKLGDGSTSWNLLAYLGWPWQQSVVPSGGNSVLGVGNTISSVGTAAAQAYVAGIGLATRYTSAVGANSLAAVNSGRSVRRGSATTEVGAGFVGHAYEFTLVVTPGGSTADWRIKDLTAGTIASNTYSGTMPGATTNPVPEIVLLTVDTALARSFDHGFMGSYSQSLPW